MHARPWPHATNLPPAEPPNMFVIIARCDTRQSGSVLFELGSILGDTPILDCEKAYVCTADCDVV